MKQHFILMSILGLGLFAGTAAADDKADAQKKVDAAKLETCEKVKKYISDQNAKGHCKDEHATAQKTTCSAATFKDMTDLNTKCMKSSVKDLKDAKDAKPVDSKKPDDKAKPDDKKPEPAAGTPKCRAMIDGKALVEVEDASSVKCSSKLMDAVRANKCTTADMKGKKVEYTVNADHKIGKNTIKDRATSLTCVKITPAK